MRAVLLDEAERDFERIDDYHEGVQVSLGDRFLDELMKALDLLESFPRLYALAYRNFRLCPLGSFKYGMFYHVGTDFAFIHAFVDLRQDPKQILKLLRSR
jgi:hypothetical protein